MTTGQSDTAALESPAMLAVGIELHVPDFEAALIFYRRLGFVPVRSEERYLVLSCGDAMIAFYGGDPAVAGHSYFGRFDSESPRGYAVELCLFVKNLDELYRTFEGDECLVAPLTQRPWGKRDFRIADPFGYYLRITEQYDPRTI